MSDKVVSTKPKREALPLIRKFEKRVESVAKKAPEFLKFTADRLPDNAELKEVFEQLQLVSDKALALVKALPDDAARKERGLAARRKISVGTHVELINESRRAELEELMDDPRMLDSLIVETIGKGTLGVSSKGGHLLYIERRFLIAKADQTDAAEQANENQQQSA